MKENITTLPILLAIVTAQFEKQKKKIFDGALAQKIPKIT